MQSDNSSYTVTTPDLFLTDDGISVLITSTNEVFVDGVKKLFEKHIDHSIVFNVQPSITSAATIPWMWYVSGRVDMMFVDLDTCAWIDVCTALLKRQDDNHSIIFYNEKNKKQEAVRLLNATGEFLILRSMEEIDAYLQMQLNSYAQ